MSALLIVATIAAVAVALVIYLRVGLRIAVAAYSVRLEREIAKYRKRFGSLVVGDGGVDYAFCERMADKGFIWGQAMVWPLLLLVRLARRHLNTIAPDPHDLDPVYLKQRIADLEDQLGLGGKR